MSFEALRFIHAANLSLDHQLHETGPLPKPARQPVEEATLTAFERIVTACIEHRVDFLLLAGDSFDERDRSLRARVALAEGFQKLAEYGIRVFVLPGRTDPPTAWQAIPQLPDNVILYLTETDDSVAVLREGRVVASVAAQVSNRSQPGETHSNEVWNQPSHPDESQRGPFSIRLVSVPSTIHRSEADSRNGKEREEDPFQNLLSSIDADYIALGGRGLRRTVQLEARVAHHPGMTQALIPGDTGPCGCTLVDVRDDGTVSRTFLPTAPVRREHFVVDMDEQTSQDDLIDRMQAILQGCHPEPGEQVWLIRWTLRGTGPVFDSLQDDATQTELLEWLELKAEEQAADSHPIRCHSLRCLPAIEPLDPSFQVNRLAADYFTYLEDNHPDTLDALLGCLRDSDVPDENWMQRLHALTAELDHELIAGHARRLGMNWLAMLPEEGPSS